MNRTSFTYKLSEEQQAVFRDILGMGNYRLLPKIEHSEIVAETPDCRIVLYKSGKCLVQGKGAEDFVLFVLEPNVLKRAEVGYDDQADSEAYDPHIGVDESGKGDFFGPLVVAGAFTDRSLAKKLMDMGVRDSKRISSDKKIAVLASGIRSILKNRYSIVLMGPAAYNRLYAKMHNVNRILAWAHARAIENLLESVPSCPRALSDQFGNKKLVQQALMSKGRDIELVQRHRAESDVAVAAASILARAAFLAGLRKVAVGFDVELSKGASARVVQDGIKLVERHGPKTLLETAKCHFKTADAVLKPLSLSRSDLEAESAEGKRS